MQMHDLVRDGRPQTWIRDSHTTHERRIAAVAGRLGPQAVNNIGY